MHTAQELKPLVAALSARDQEFATDLIRAAESPRGASAKQAYWIDKMWHAAQAPTPISTPNILALFAKASAAGLKEPKLRFQTDCGTRIKMILGVDAIRVYAGNFPNRKFQGAIAHAAASFRPAAECKPRVIALIIALEADTTGFSANNGRQIGMCCFCGAALTDDRSLLAGYGPVCAQRWGLPWGQTAGQLSLEELGL